jgi:hypothetical protein
MEPNHQLFGHYLYHHLEMQHDVARQNDDIMSAPKRKWNMRAALGKLLKPFVNSYPRSETKMEREMLPNGLPMCEDLDRTGSV